MSIFHAEQRIIVTGAGSGIGRATALLCNQRGATVIAVGRDMAKLEQARSEAAFPSAWHCESIDLVKQIEELPGWMSNLRQQYGKFRAIIHTAGESLMDSLQSSQLEQIRHQLEINTLVPFMLAKAFADRRNSEKGGAMVFFSSVVAIRPTPGRLSYGAAKAALAAGMAAFSRELAGRLRVNCISPALVDTPMTQADDAALGGTYLSEQAKRYPLGLGRPEDVASLAVFLVSEEARWITGQNYILDGGCH